MSGYCINKPHSELKGSAKWPKEGSWEWNAYRMRIVHSGSVGCMYEGKELDRVEHSGQVFFKKTCPVLQL